ncbi:MAG: FecR domain-containing protein [Steroidobacteraceae bacterium]
MEEASAWVIKLNAGKVARDDIFAFDDWLNEDEAHRQAFRKMARAWHDAGTLFDLYGKPVKEPLSIRRISAAWAQLNPIRTRIAAMTALVAILIVGWFLSVSLLPHADPAFEQMAARTQVGERKTIDLTDGSTVQLNTDTEVEVVYTNAERKVRLLKGEAHFKVAKNAQRPFRVYVGNGAVEAVGTAFTVYLNNKGTTEVTVTEGEVKLTRILPARLADRVGGTGSEKTIASVSAGRDAVFGEDLISVEAIDKEDLTKKLSWRNGKLLFNGDTLETAVHEFRRYTQADIVILDQEIKDTRIVGYFSADDVQKFLHTLETSFDIGVRFIDDNKVYLYHKDKQG